MLVVAGAGPQPGGWSLLGESRYGAWDSGARVDLLSAWRRMGAHSPLGGVLRPTSCYVREQPMLVMSSADADEHYFSAVVGVCVASSPTINFNSTLVSHLVHFIHPPSTTHPPNTAPLTLSGGARGHLPTHLFHTPGLRWGSTAGWWGSLAVSLYAAGFGKCLLTLEEGVNVCACVSLCVISWWVCICERVSEP